MNLKGICYLFGIGTEPDSVQATLCFTRALAGGDRMSGYNLGVCALKGIGLFENADSAVNITEAREVLTFSASKGHAPSAALLKQIGQA